MADKRIVIVNIYNDRVTVGNDETVWTTYKVDLHKFNPKARAVPVLPKILIYDLFDLWVSGWKINYRIAEEEKFDYSER